MDPISIISLVGTCAALATRVVVTASSVDEFVQSYRGADRSVASLASTLRVFGESLTQMRSWLEQEPAVSSNLRRTIKSSVDDCEVVLADLEQHVNAILRSSRPGSRGSILAGLTFGRKLKHWWSASSVAKHETRLNSQVQTVMHLINFVQLNNTDQQDSAVDTPETRTIISRSANAANLVRSTRDPSTIRGSTIYTNVGDEDQELEVDEELIRSPTYLAQYRAMMRGQYRSSRSGSSLLAQQVEESGSPTGASSLSDKTYRRARKLLLKSLTWSLSPESRKLARHLCQAAEAGNIKWIESLVKEGAYINGWIINENPETGQPIIRQTPLMHAIIGRKPDAFNLLLDLGADLEAKDLGHHTVWNYAIRNNPELAVHMLERNIYPDIGMLPALLLHVVIDQRVDLLKLLLKRARISHVNHLFELELENPSRSEYDSLLWRAVQVNNLSMVKLLVENGAKVDRTLPSHTIKRLISYTPLFSLRGPTPLFAVSHRVECFEMLEYLVSKGASLTSIANCTNGPGNVDGTWPIARNVNITSLHLARGACAEFLIKKGANVFAVDDEGRTPLFWAVGMCEYEPDLAAVVANLAQGSPPNLEDKLGLTPLAGLATSILRFKWLSMKSLQISLAVVNALLGADAIPLGRYKQKDTQLVHYYTLLDKRRGGVIKSNGITGHIENREGNYLLGIYLDGEWCHELDGQLTELRADDGTMKSGHVALHPEARHVLEADRSEHTSALVKAFVELCDLILTGKRLPHGDG